LSNEKKEEEDIVDQLADSFKKVGPMRHIINTRFGIVSGETRKKASEKYGLKWPEKTIEVRDEYDFLQRKASDNIHGQKNDAWWKRVVDRVAEVLLAEPFNLKATEVGAKLLHDFPISESRLYRVLDDKYKDPYFVAIRKKEEEERINKPSKESLQIHPTKEESVGRLPTEVLPKPTPTPASETFGKKEEKGGKEN